MTKGNQPPPPAGSNDNKLIYASMARGLQGPALVPEGCRPRVTKPMETKAILIAETAAAIATGTPLHANLSWVELRVMEVLSTREGLTLKPHEVAERAGVSGEVYYRLRQDPTFLAKYRAACMNYMHGRLGEVIEVAIKSALIEGREGAQDRRLLFEATGLAMRRGDGQQDRAMQTVGDMPDAHLVFYYLMVNWPRDRWLPAVRARYEAGLITPEQPDALPGLPTPATPTTPTSMEAEARAAREAEREGEGDMPAPTEAGPPTPRTGDEGVES